MDLKVGDLVMLVKPTPCCGSCVGLGRPFIVTEINDDPSRCAHCGDMSRVIVAGDNKGVIVDARRLIKIDPPAEMKDTETTKELTV